MKHDGGLSAAIDRWYLPFALLLWFFIPEMRRLVDWRVGANSISFLSVVPMLFLAPLLIPVLRRLTAPELTLPYRCVCYAWLFGFIYAFVVAFAGGGRFDALYQFAQFCLPLAFATWVVTRPVSRAESFRQLAATFSWAGLFVGLYGIYQYVSPPEWDIAWVNNANLASVGVPEPFGLRVFSTLNSPDTAAFFFVFVILLNLYKLDVRRPLTLASITVCVAALALTSVRSAWLAAAVGVVTFLAVTPRRGRPAAALGAIAVVSVILGLNAPALLGYRDVTTQIIARFNTLSDVQSDVSADDRRRETADAARSGFEEPLGMGLGTVGTSTKLGGRGSITLDNGFLARFVEMGIAGFVAYLVALIGAIVLTLRVLMRARARDDRALQDIAATAAGIQVAMLGMDLSLDSHNGLTGIVFWLVVALTLSGHPEDEDAHLAATERGPSNDPRGGKPAWA